MPSKRTTAAQGAGGDVGEGQVLRAAGGGAGEAVDRLEGLALVEGEGDGERVVGVAEAIAKVHADAGDVARGGEGEGGVALALDSEEARLDVVQDGVEVGDGELAAGGLVGVGGGFEGEGAFVGSGGEGDGVAALGEGGQRGLGMLDVVGELEGVEAGALAREFELEAVVVLAEDGLGEVDGAGGRRR